MEVTFDFKAAKSDDNLRNSILLAYLADIKKFVQSYTSKPLDPKGKSRSTCQDLFEDLVLYTLTEIIPAYANPPIGKKTNKVVPFKSYLLTRLFWYCRDDGKYDREDENIELPDLIDPASEEAFHEVEQQEVLALLPRLEPKEKKVVELRMGLNPKGKSYTYTEIGQMLHVSHPAVLKTYRIALAKLKHLAGAGYKTPT